MFTLFHLNGVSIYFSCYFECFEFVLIDFVFMIQSYVVSVRIVSSRLQCFQIMGDPLINK